TVAGSVALLGFGIDSFVESASGAVPDLALPAEKAGSLPGKHQALDERAHKLVAFTLFALAVYVAIDACSTLWNRERPDSSPLGIAVTALSLGVMWWLAREKRRAALALGSRALEADSFPDDGVLVVVADRARRRRSQCTLRLVVGRSVRRARHDLVSRQGGETGMGRSRRLLFANVNRWPGAGDVCSR